MLFLLATLATLHAEPATCADPVPLVRLRATLLTAETNFSEMDLSGFEGAVLRAREELDCVSERLQPGVAAAWHRVMALSAWTRQDMAAVDAEFSAMRALSPDIELPHSYAPPGGPMASRFAAVELPHGAFEPLVAPRGYAYVADGSLAPGSRPDVPVVLQLVTKRGEVVWTRALAPGEAPPTVLSDDPLPEEILGSPEPTRRRVVLASTTAGVLLLSGGLYALSGVEACRYRDTSEFDEPFDEHELTKADLADLRHAANTAFWASMGAGTLGLGLGVVTVLRW